MVYNMTMHIHSKIVIPTTSFAQIVDDEMVILDTRSENYFGLDEVGTSIWQAMQEKETLQDVLKVLLEEYEVEEDVLKKDLFEFIEKLLKSGLVKVEDN